MQIRNRDANPQTQPRRHTMNRGRLIRGAAMLGLFIIGGGLFILMARADTWRGTAPFCAGECLPGEKEIARSNSGNGASCWTGSKVLCRNAEPTCQALQTNVVCKAVTLICDNGFYTQTTNQPDWHSCSTYLCGICAGWWSDWKEPVIGTAGSLTALSVPSLPRDGRTVLPDLPYGPDTCKAGYVWREAIPNDHVCVAPESRDQAKQDNAQRANRINPTDHSYGPDTCAPDYVWREVVPSDHVCVTPEIRDQTKVENSQFETNRARGALW
jgi:hypothetical protein